jgi:hypothetical protein
MDLHPGRLLCFRGPGQQHDGSISAREFGYSFKDRHGHELRSQILDCLVDVLCRSLIHDGVGLRFRKALEGE